MSAGFIVFGEGERRRRVPVGSSLVIGRGARCGLVIHDAAASRQHAEIRLSDSGYMCHDLDSKNGTAVNGTPVSSCELEHGDRIQIGETVLRFELGEDHESTAPEKTVFLHTVVDSAGQVRQKIAPSRPKQLLEAAYTVMNAIATNFEPCALVDTILRATTEAARARRGAVLFAGADEELQPCPVCGSVHTIVDGILTPAHVDEIQISETVARRVLRDGENVLFQSARGDSAIDPTVSMRALNLTSILCVPIRTQNRILGILYIDTDVADHSYNDDDLLLAAAAGNSAGLALENARIHRLLLDKQRIEQEIAAAWTIQRGFLVKDWPSGDRRFQVYGETRPAKVVGGDFYDFVQLGPDVVGLLIGDVSGKGVPAALTMAQLLAEFRLCVRGIDSPAEVLRLLNEGLVSRSERGTFCTMSFVVIDLASGRVTAANAGHHPAVLLSGDRVDTLFGATGPPTGVLPDGVWSDESSQLRPGQTVLLYTDGIVEARDGSIDDESDEPDTEYQLDRLTRFVASRNGDDPHALIDSILLEVKGFCAPRLPHDDCTMIALRYRGGGR